MTYTVYFEDTGEEREVVGVCKRCKERSLDLQVESAPIIGPRGIAHEQSWLRDERTVCGKDATGPRWWWRF
jgi:hypothetical protein